MRHYVGTITLILGLNGYGCDCQPIPETAEAYKSASLVAHVRVIDSNLQKPLEQNKAYVDSLSTIEQRLRMGPVYVNEYKIIVLEGFKGALLGDTLILRTALHPMLDCGLLLSEGNEIVLFANQVSYGHRFYDNSVSHSVITTSICSRTQSYNRKEVKRLKKMSRSR